MASAGTPPAPLRGAITRRYHGLLIAALPNPLGRMMMLNRLSERFRLPDGRAFFIGGARVNRAVQRGHAADVCGIPAGSGLPVWGYELET